MTEDQNAANLHDPKRQPPTLYTGWRDLGFNWTWHLGLYPVVRRV